MFDQAIQVIFKHEGGYVDHPNDPGGETNFGISRRAFPNEDIKNLTKQRAKEIYYQHYWSPLNLYRLDNANVCLELFDMAVNAGKSRAVRMAQRLIGVKVDGKLGPLTAMAINNYQRDFVMDYKHARKVFYEYLANKYSRYNVFLKGWLNRVNDCYFINI